MIYTNQYLYMVSFSLCLKKLSFNISYIIIKVLAMNPFNFANLAVSLFYFIFET